MIHLLLYAGLTITSPAVPISENNKPPALPTICWHQGHHGLACYDGNKTTAYSRKEGVLVENPTFIEDAECTIYGNAGGKITCLGIRGQH